jgi:hypothetical protein
MMGIDDELSPEYKQHLLNERERTNSVHDEHLIAEYAVIHETAKALLLQPYWDQLLPEAWIPKSQILIAHDKPYVMNGFPVMELTIPTWLAKKNWSIK